MPAPSLGVPSFLLARDVQMEDGQKQPCLASPAPEGS